ncbi:hypothetical protein ACRE_029080 [Hapsidospora chrysogenum ATCC 11550]|uniref:Ilp is an apoptosis inhibitor n=1 Tax=Hapsidospora chrysogenum (strain ATCC 11550 / CBS 779.69 / DSM 880 / IAM 14645 / JCM 23072 / IMI 49137) TaxID=857340 RepID=A0A086TAA1_HAPC1|nr:hypothetical protein ACRE_029080 [Hapsidospora chrysogenum ATCC 11550]
MSVPFTHPFQENQFDIFEWYPQFQSCQRHFLEHAQYSSDVQAVAAFVNIKLPCQKHTSSDSRAAATVAAIGQEQQQQQQQQPLKSSPIADASASTALLIPYIRRLVATAFDSPAVLHGFFGDDWPGGIGPIHETERRNYLFAAKSDTWLSVKNSYDMEDGQAVPFLRPLRDVTLDEIQAAEAGWSGWLAMQDWMLGPRDPDSDERATGGPFAPGAKGRRN